MRVRFGRVTVGRAPDATGVDHPPAVRQLQHLGLMAVTAQDDAGRVAPEPLCDPRGWRPHQTAVCDILNQICGVGIWLRVKRDDAGRKREPGRQVTQPRTLLVVERCVRKDIGRPTRRIGFIADPAVVIAAYCGPVLGRKNRHGLGRPQRPGDAVAEIDDGIDPTARNVGTHDFERTGIAVDVGDYGDAHGALKTYHRHPPKCLHDAQQE
jgi:hypothetical protein